MWKGRSKAGQGDREGWRDVILSRCSGMTWIDSWVDERNCEWRYQEGCTVCRGEQVFGATKSRRNASSSTQGISSTKLLLYSLLLCLPHPCSYKFSFGVGTKRLSIRAFLGGLCFKVNFMTHTNLPQHESLGPVSTSEEILLKVVVWRHFSKWR